VKGAPEIRSELAGVHTTIGREKGFCVLGSLAQEQEYYVLEHNGSQAARP
jgi:hypothetical protein